MRARRTTTPTPVHRQDTHWAPGTYPARPGAARGAQVGPDHTRTKRSLFSHLSDFQFPESISLVTGLMCFTTQFQKNQTQKYLLRPACFLSLRTTQHDFWSATQRGADYAEALETCRCTYKAEYASGPVPEPVQCIYQCDLLSEPEFSGYANGICSEVLRNRVQMSVCAHFNRNQFLTCGNGNNADRGQ